MSQPLTQCDIKIITTGGTIDKVYFDQKSSFQVGESQIDDVLAGADVGFRYSIETLLKKDSLDLTDGDRQAIRDSIADDSDYRHFVVTHGTDTMVETAKVLQGIAGKVIVLTGSMQPARFQNSSAIFNIGCAVAVVQVLDPGVYVVMNGRVFAPERVFKNVEANRFEDVVE